MTLNEVTCLEEFGFPSTTSEGVSLGIYLGAKVLLQSTGLFCMHYVVTPPSQYSSWKIQACGLYYTTMKVSKNVNDRTTHQQLRGWSSSSSKSVSPRTLLKFLH
jgi:hypothetical protein